MNITIEKTLKKSGDFVTIQSILRIIQKLWSYSSGGELGTMMIMTMMMMNPKVVKIHLFLIFLPVLIFFFFFFLKNGRTWAFLQWRKTVFISSSQKFSEFRIVIIYAPGNSIFVVKCYFSSLRRNRSFTQCYQSPSQVQEKKRLRTDKHGLTKRHDIVCERKAKIPYCSYHYWNRK